jgi:hypothetical protein
VVTPSASAANNNGSRWTSRRGALCLTCADAGADTLATPDALLDELSLNRNCATAMSPMRAWRSFSRHRWI